MKVALALCLLWLVHIVPAQGEERLWLRGDFVQGGLIVGETLPGTDLRLGERTVRVGPDGVFLFGFGRDHGPSAVLSVTYPDGRRERRDLSIARRSYKVQRIEGLPRRMVTPPAEVLDRIRRENARIAEVRRRDTAEPFFAGGFVWPLIGTVTGVFGSQRVLNGKPRRPHYGIDIAGPSGAPVFAPSDALVAMAEPDLYFTGGTVMLDHGHGLTSVYSHLRDVSVKAGQRVRQGDVIGTVGSTGRSTGPHLDWRFNWFDQRLDPALVAGPMPKSKTP